MKKKTKKQHMSVKEKKTLLDQLLVCEEEQSKIDVGQQRIYRRGEALEKKRGKICQILGEGIALNCKEKIKTPLFYKSNCFQLSSDWNSSRYYEYSVTIKKVKKL